jgi:hypothetical protein
MKKTHFFSPIIFTAIILFLVPSCKKDEPATNPVLSTSSVTNITVSTATSGGNITSDGGAKITARGVCWGPTANPTTSDSKTVDGDGTGQFVSDITGINPGSTYYVRAYATNSVGTSYGNEITFKSYDIMDIDCDNRNSNMDGWGFENDKIQ